MKIKRLLFLAIPVLVSVTYADWNLAAGHSLISAASHEIRVIGNLNNSGTFTHGNGLISFAGTSVQAVTGVAAFGSLKINNSAGMTLNTACTVEDNLYLTAGEIITSASSLLTLLAGATVTPGGGSSASFVSGPMAMMTNSTAEYIFPIGNTVYAPITIQPSGSSASTYKTRYMNSAYSPLTFDGTLTGISDDEYWEIERTSGATALDSLKLSWDTPRSDFSGNTMTVNNLTIARFNGINWIKDGRDDWRGNFDESGWATVKPHTEISGNTTFTFGKSTTLSVNDLHIPDTFLLSNAYPNPFNPQISFSYQLPHRSDVEISIYNLKGQKVDELVRSYQNPGTYTVTWNSGSLSSGVYLITMNADNFSSKQKITALK